MISSGQIFRCFLFLTVPLAGLMNVFSCSESKEEERKVEWIKNEVRVKISEYKTEKRAECFAEILKAAETEVDSILRQKDLFGNLINHKIPYKPLKPEYIPLDSAAINNHKVEKVLK